MDPWLWLSQSCFFVFLYFFRHCWCLLYSSFLSIGKYWSSCFHELSFRLKGGVHFHCIAFNYSCADWDSLGNHLRDDQWKDIFRVSAFAAAAAAELCEWVKVGIDVYIPQGKYQVKPHSSPWILVACIASIAYRNQIFHLYQHNKSSESNVKFKQASSHCNSVLEAAKLTYANKKRLYHFPETWLMWLFNV